ncbi:hypothetical protein K461DRAFT_266032 [Myriangium duriaei CBS 260.36]|uniref:Something about silencing protein 4 domain-containing protein n=1 Tax=Myriangium duriaei CBS 260.36 TaxID=1168546 RepID=A0A9P4J5T7_9PEZI|nr:hypothetical protein K461DRAFT_266032 [Myriangium duriaei CBS 260.36]
MLNSLQPVKRAPKTNDSNGPTTHTTTSPASRAITARQKSSTRKQVNSSSERASKRQKLTTGEPTSDLATRPKPSSKLRNSTPRQPQKLSSLNTSALPPRPPNLIDHYFTPSDSYQSDETEKPPDNLYDAIQKRVHDAEAKSEDKRTLRSQDESSRLKSALSVYFPNYDEVINDTPKELELLTPDTIFIIRDDGKRRNQQAPSDTSRSGNASTQQKHQRRRSSHVTPVQTPQSSPLAKFNGAQVVDFSIIEKSIDQLGQDPLTDDVYFKAHRRAERKEKQLRNIERERAMHEKVQLERLLDGLQGYDWLRVMGVTGVTDSEAQRYQSKRDYFIREVRALVLKFQEWREEEKRQKSEKSSAHGKLGQEIEDDLDQDERASREPSSSEIDASAARQLQQEASGSAKAKVRQRISAHVAPIVYRAPTPEGPFTSFFDKPHLRSAALGKNRHGRNILAFGLPVPDVDEHEFELPHGYITPQSLKESARRRRRMKRESVVDSASKK